MEKGTKKKIIYWVVFGILAALIITFVVVDRHLFTNSSVFKTAFMGKDTEGQDVDLIANPTLRYLFRFGFPSILRTIQIVIICVFAAILLQQISKIKVGGKKAITILKLLCNFIKWTIAIAGVFLIMASWGVDTIMIIASAGVLTLIIGLGSQTLIADILAGIFIVFEGDFQVGDIIIIDGWRGEVQVIGIRTTKLLDAGGNVKIVNNSEIKTIINQTKEYSLALCYVAISYEDRIEKVEAVIADNIDKLKEKIPLIVEGPFYKGVSELGESSVNLLFVAKCNENDIYQVQRDLNREIKIMFDNNGINIPFNQLVVHMGKNDEPSQISKKEIQKAEEFAREQKELSKAMEIKSDGEQ